MILMDFCASRRIGPDRWVTQYALKESHYQSKERFVLVAAFVSLAYGFIFDSARRLLGQVSCLGIGLSSAMCCFGAVDADARCR